MAKKNQIGFDNLEFRNVQVMSRDEYGHTKYLKTLRISGLVVTYRNLVAFNHTQYKTYGNVFSFTIFHHVHKDKKDATIYAGLMDCDKCYVSAMKELSEWDALSIDFLTKNKAAIIDLAIKHSIRQLQQDVK